MPLATIGIVLIAGAGIAFQAVVNARLREGVQSPVLSALISFLVGGAVLALLALSGVMGRGRLPPLGTLPWWAWIGGLFGAFYVTIAVVAVPRIGMATLIACTVFGQLAAALVFDTMGWFGLSRLPLSWPRALGALLLLAGVLLMQRK